MRAKGPRAPASATDPYACAWTTAGKPCLLAGEASRSIGEGVPYYCGWHYALVEQPRFAADREEFDRFVLAQRERRTLAGQRVLYCCVWAHHDHQELWFAVNGISPLRPAEPCEAQGCRVRRSRGTDRPATNAEALAAIREAREMLRGKRGAMVETVAGVVGDVPF